MKNAQHRALLPQQNLMFRNLITDCSIQVLKWDKPKVLGEGQEREQYAHRPPSRRVNTMRWGRKFTRRVVGGWD